MSMLINYNKPDDPCDDVAHWFASIKFRNSLKQLKKRRNSDE